MKLTKVVLDKSVLISGDSRNTWLADQHGADMTLDERGIVHIRYRGQHFMSSSFVGAWADDGTVEKPATRKARPAEPVA
jgi:hypothetical protein